MADENVKNRMLQEKNPSKGRMPAFPAQFFDKDGYPKLVNEENPLPSGNYVMTDGGVWVPQKGDEDGNVNARLTGSIVEIQNLDFRVIYQKGKEFTNSTMFKSGIPDLSKSDSYVSYSSDFLRLYAKYTNTKEDNPKIGVSYNLDLTNIYTLIVDWEQKGNYESSKSFLKAESDALMNRTGAFSRSTDVLDVSDLSINTKIELYAYSAWNSTDRHTDLIIYGLWGVR